MKSKLYLLFALLSLTAVFASPALAAPPVPTITGPETGAVVDAFPLVSVTTDVPADSVQIYGLGGIALGFATPTDGTHMSWVLGADLSNWADTPTYSITAIASTIDGSSSDSVLVELDAVPAPTAPSWLSPNESGMELWGEINLRTITVAGIDSVEYFFDGYPIGQGVETNGGTSSTWDFPLNLDVRPLGSHTITAVAHEGAESSIESSTTVTTIDGTSPVINSILPAHQTVVSGTVQLVASITDNRGVQSAEYSVDEGETWHPMFMNGMPWQAALDTTQLPNGQVVVYVRAFDANPANYAAESAVVLDVRNNVAPVLNTDEVELFGTLMVGGPGISAEGATATGFPEPEITYGWFVCETLVSNCTFHDTVFYTPTAAELGYTVRLVVRATNAAPFGSVSQNILVGTVFAAPVAPSVDPTPTPTPIVNTPVVVPPVVNTPVTPPVKTPEVVAVEKKIDAADTKAEKAVAASKAADKQAAKAKAEVKQAMDYLAVKKAALAKAVAKSNQMKAPLKAAGRVVPGGMKRQADEVAKDLAAAEKAVADAALKVAIAQKTAVIAEKKANDAELKESASKKTLDKNLEELAAKTNQKPVVVKAEHKVEKAEEKLAEEVAEQKVAEQKVVKAKAEVKETKAVNVKAKAQVKGIKAVIVKAKAEVKETKAEVKEANENLAAKQEAADKAKAKADQTAAELKEAATAKAKAELKKAADKAAADLAAKQKAEAEAKIVKSKATGEAKQAESKLKKASSDVAAAETKAKATEKKVKTAEMKVKTAETKAVNHKKDIKASQAELSNRMKELAKVKTP